MASLKIKLGWSTPQVEGMTWRVGLFGIHRRNHAAMPDLKNRSSRVQRQFMQRTLHVSLRGCLLWTLAMCVAGYFVAGYAIFHVQSSMPHNRITYTDVILPWRWSELDTKRGQALIDQARDEIEEGKFAAGFSRLRMGLDRNPVDTQARQDLSQVYILRRLRSHSDRLLMDAFTHGYPGIDYVRTAYRTITYSDNPPKETAFIAAARAALATNGGPPADAGIIDELAIETLLRTGKETEALKLAHRLYPEDSDERLEVELAAALALKDYDRATAVAARRCELAPRSEELLAKASGVYRLAGRLDDMQVCIDRLRKNSPLNPALAAFNVVQNILAGRDTIARAALDDALFRFGADPRELAIWSRDIAETGRDDYLARIEQFMAEHGHDLRSILFARMLAQIRGRQWVEAQGTALRIRERESRMTEGERLRVAVITGLAGACLDAGGGAQQVFIDAYQRSPMSLEFSRMMVEALLAADRPETAGQLITLAEGNYPESHYMTEAAGRVNERLLALREAEEKARPAAEVVPGDKLADAASLFAELKRLDANGKTDEALGLIRAVRKRDPRWLAGNEEGLLLSELDLSIRAKDLTLLHLTLKTYLRGPFKDGPKKVMQKATGWHAEGLKTESLMAVRELLKRQEDFQPALAALAAWDPKPLPVADQPQ